MKPADKITPVLRYTAAVGVLGATIEQQERIRQETGRWII